ncbi:MAG: SagB/ThcOx family dehydrogenase [bacterium]|nr:SagB/ThcOx family dehydrogenase [bacterium]
MSTDNAVIDYHLATKHHHHRYANSLGYLDWANQPNPFRRYEDAPVLPLPLVAEDDSPPFEQVYVPGSVSPLPAGRDVIARFLEHSLALSAWKEYQGERWALRCNPSSGNLHPTEGYIVAGPVAELSDTPAVYHYAPADHALEQRTVFLAETWQALSHGFPEGTFFAGLTSIHWREAWKYGERAYRYCQHDVGHALAAYAYAAAMTGWCVVHLEGLGDADVGRLLGVRMDDEPPPPLNHSPEPEHPDLIVAVVPAQPAHAVPRTLSANPVRAIAEGVWNGAPNRLSGGHVEWPVIDRAARAAGKDRMELAPAGCSGASSAGEPECGKTARGIVLQRRSAAAMDASAQISRDTFYRMLSRLMPDRTCVPWDSLAPPTAVHAMLFVHRVDGLAPGLYILVRDPAAKGGLRHAMRKSFDWARPEGCPDALPLYRLERGRCDRSAGHLSCGQAIAADGVFSVGFLARFEPLIAKHGPWFYRRLFWEAGMAGQVLYLEAEAAGLGGTGIGCYFDNPVHDVLGIRDLAFQSLYHFTVGRPVVDARLTTLPPYAEPRQEGRG